MERDYLAYGKEMKTPEKMAEEYAAMTTNNLFYREPLSNAFLAGYKAAQEHAHAALEEAEAEMAKMKDQLADVSIVIDPAIQKRLKTAVVGPDGDDAADAYIDHLEQLIADHNAGVSKVMPDSCDHILDMEKMVDVKRCSCSGILNNWISMKKWLPPKGEWVLFWYPWGHEVNKLKWIGPKGQLDFHRDYYGESESKDRGPSHWTSLLQPPKEEA